jgi:hypothetical protein
MVVGWFGWCFSLVTPARSSLCPLGVQRCADLFGTALVAAWVVGVLSGHGALLVLAAGLVASLSGGGCFALVVVAFVSCALFVAG